jgi:hypothetical protein
MQVTMIKLPSGILINAMHIAFLMTREQWAATRYPGEDVKVAACGGVVRVGAEILYLQSDDFDYLIKSYENAIASARAIAGQSMMQTMQTLNKRGGVS